MKKKSITSVKFLLGLIFFICPVFHLVFALSLPFTHPYVNSLSNNAGAFGNPAGLSPKSGPYANLKLNLEKNNSFESLQLDMKGSKFAIGYEYIDANYQGKLAMAKSFSLSENFHLGLEWEYVDWAGGNGFGFNYGIQWEPFSWVKFGYFTQNLWQSHSTNGRRASQQYGIGLRPLAMVARNSWGHQFSLYYEGLIAGFSQNEWEDQQKILGAQAELIRGIYLNGQFDLEEPENMSLGFYIQTSPRDFLGYLQSESNGQAAKNQYLLQLHGNLKQSAIGQQGKVAILDLNTNIQEGYGMDGWILSEQEIGHLDVIKQIQLLYVTPGIKSILLKTGRTGCSFAVATEIRKELLKAREKGIYIGAFMETTSTLSYYLASAADYVSMPPSSYFDVQGFSAQVFFIKNFLAKFGIEPQFIKHGDYKSYPEMFTNDSISPEYKQNLSSLLEELFETYVKDVSSSRKLTSDSLQKLLSSPEISIAAAVERGLLDSAMYIHEMVEMEAFKYPKFKVELKGQDLYEEAWSSPPTLAVLQIEGTLMEGGNGNGNPLTGEISGSDHIIRQIRRAKKDPHIEGLLLRLNSGGGSAVASDVIYEELLQFKNTGKPLIASVGSVCASGCYYLASAADLILGTENSVVGSIGIFGGKFVAKNTLEKLGINHETINSNEHADAKSILRQWNSKEVESIQQFMDTFYERFLNVVQKSRKIEKDSLENLASGRVFLGSQAIENGLLDRIGGFEESLEALKLKIGLPKGRSIQLISLNKAPDIFHSSKTLLQNNLKGELQRYMEDQKRFTQNFKVWALWPGSFYNWQLD